MISPSTRHLFDSLLDEVIAELPDLALELIERVPVTVDDYPTDEELSSIGIDPSDQNARTELCGLHYGLMATERSIDDPDTLPSTIRLFRAGILATANDVGGTTHDAAIRDQIRITLLHELGHEFGLDEDDLEQMGYA